MVIAIALISLALGYITWNTTNTLIEIFFETVFDFINGGNKKWVIQF